MVLKETRMTGLSVGKNKVLICDTIPECDWLTDILSDGISWVKRTSITLMVLERGKKCEGRRNKVHVHYQWMNVNVHTHDQCYSHDTSQCCNFPLHSKPSNVALQLTCLVKQWFPVPSSGPHPPWTACVSVSAFNVDTMHRISVCIIISIINRNCCKSTTSATLLIPSVLCQLLSRTFSPGFYSKPTT